jgi:hypothetical protein
MRSMTTLVHLEDANLTVVDPAEDMRGRRVLGRRGEDLGTVRSMLVDEDDSTVRFLEVSSGGFLGLGTPARLVPVETISGLEDDAVHLDTTRHQFEDSPPYEPDPAPGMAFYAAVYASYRLGVPIEVPPRRALPPPRGL